MLWQLTGKLFKRIVEIIAVKTKIIGVLSALFGGICCRNAMLMLLTVLLLVLELGV